MTAKCGENINRITLDHAILTLQWAARKQEEREMEESVKYFHVSNIPDKGE